MRKRMIDWLVVIFDDDASGIGHSVGGRGGGGVDGRRKRRRRRSSSVFLFLVFPFLFFSSFAVEIQSGVFFFIAGCVRGVTTGM